MARWFLEGFPLVPEIRLGDQFLSLLFAWWARRSGVPTERLVLVIDAEGKGEHPVCSFSFLLWAKAGFNLPGVEAIIVIVTVYCCRSWPGANSASGS